MTLLEGLLLALAAGMTGALAGAAATRWLARRAPKKPPSQAELALERLTALFQWTDSFARDVSDYYGEMEKIATQSGVQPSEAAGGPSPAGASPPRHLLQILTRVWEANDRLRKRLDAAEGQLQSQRDELAEVLSEARTDGLTGLPNRRAFDDELARRVAERRRYGAPVSLALIDVDHFKSLNDTHGHLAGDQALREIACALRGALRECDLVARYGGEEFAAILPNTAEEAARLAIERARQAIERTPIVHDGKEIRVTVSCGAAGASPQEGAADLIARADAALYAAKRGGRNNSHWHDGQRCGAVEKGGLGVEPAPSPEPDASDATDSCRAEEGSLREFQQVCHNLRRRLREMSGDRTDESAQRI